MAKSQEELIYIMKRNAFGKLHPVIQSWEELKKTILDDCKHSGDIVKPSYIRDWIIEQFDLSMGMGFDEVEVLLDDEEETEEEETEEETEEKDEV